MKSVTIQVRSKPASAVFQNVSGVGLAYDEHNPLCAVKM